VIPNGTGRHGSGLDIRNSRSIDRIYDGSPSHANKGSDPTRIKRVTGHEHFLRMTKMQKIRKFEEDNKSTPKEKMIPWKPGKKNTTEELPRLNQHFF
jgi:hypothetical protein